MGRGPRHAYRSELRLAPNAVNRAVHFGDPLFTDPALRYPAHRRRVGVRHQDHHRACRLRPVVLGIHADCGLAGAAALSAGNAGRAGQLGSAAGTLLVGNFGDGRINISANNGRHFAHHVTGPVRGTSTGKPFAEPGLQGLLSGTATSGGSDALWFTDGFLADR